jgi:hypothetical protein
MFITALHWSLSWARKIHPSINLLPNSYYMPCSSPLIWLIYYLSTKTNCDSNMHGSDDATLHSGEFLGSVHHLVHRTCFGTWTCFRPQVKIWRVACSVPSNGPKGADTYRPFHLRTTTDSFPEKLFSLQPTISKVQKLNNPKENYEACPTWMWSVAWAWVFRKETYSCYVFSISFTHQCNEGCDTFYFLVNGKLQNSKRQFGSLQNYNV